ncbi:SGNH/GDSL hydrolase family protein [Paenibacillus sp. MMS20-IR301]|uniref:SGNH/GDSL hydrolase family protein n=1 Tax=Paenibacillus sp. MMS20-IR301 TaxID=2895946 RepID=UPI0028F06E4D|nr:SGNH/GDSL hydrolase family protein [Paenibacillus sp. MMS20-IR301]WNS44665.1 SGNH/GDSL hydrolase family protein [Paenibacillus sp. MMS20-IR301]
MSRDPHLNSVTLAELAAKGHLKLHGRTSGIQSPVTLFWTGSAVELNVQASGLWIEVESGYDEYESWISILINSVQVSRQMLNAGRHWIPVFRGMSRDTVKNIRIVKEVQAMSGDPGCYLQFHAVRTDGEFLPVEAKPYRLEFIGDSITSGEGAIGAKQEADWIPAWFSSVHNYTALTAEALEAEYRVISQSGWGVLTSWDNNPQHNIPGIYGQVCGLLSGPHNEMLGAQLDNDFASWQPEVVVVNLGTNDDGAFHNPEWRNPDTGQSYKQRLNADGSYNEEDLAAFEDAVIRFLAKLRQCNKEAHILWAYGMAGAPLLPAIERAVQAYRSSSGDKKVSVLELPAMTEETTGARSHPGLPAHQQAADVLIGYIRQLL